jgi:hypothetical protein
MRKRNSWRDIVAYKIHFNSKIALLSLSCRQQKIRHQHNLLRSINSLYPLKVLQKNKKKLSLIFFKKLPNLLPAKVFALANFMWQKNSLSRNLLLPACLRTLLTKIHCKICSQHKKLKRQPFNRKNKTKQIWKVKTSYVN